MREAGLFEQLTRTASSSFLHHHEPPEAEAEGQRLQGSIAPPQSSAEIGDMAASGMHLKANFNERDDTCAGYARILAAANKFIDMSVKEAYDSGWKDKVRTRIRPVGGRHRPCEREFAVVIGAKVGNRLRERGTKRESAVSGPTPTTERTLLALRLFRGMTKTYVTSSTRCEPDEKSSRCRDRLLYGF